jgi:hypothetical protein
MGAVLKSKSKSKGNRFENQISKDLGVWIFNDKNFFQRHITSGAIKTVYVGDIIPIKKHKWVSFPFIIECKHGYEKKIPTLFNYSIITQWLTKLENEKTETQHVIWLIVRFHNQRKVLLITNNFIKSLEWDLAINLVINEKSKPFFIYDFNKLTKLNFFECYDIEVIKESTNESKDT